MRAVVYDDYGQPPRLVDVPEPECPDDGVVIRVGATGVCRSDWHAWMGHDPVALPHIPGHELAGVVARVGRDVTRWRQGDRVTAPFVCGCGRCELCTTGQAQVCPDQTQPGFSLPGSFAEQVAVHAADTNLVALPESVDFVSAASLGCRFATAFRALTGHRSLHEGDWLAVHGCGGVGLSAVMIAAALGARIVAVDVSPAALCRAGELGAQVTVDATEQDPVEAVLAATGTGAHLSLDALGSQATAVASVRCLRPRGSHVQVGLLLGAEATPPIPMDQVVAKELSVHGSHGMAARDYPGLLDMVASGRLRPDLLVGEVIGLEQAPAALTAMGRPHASAGMTVIAMADPAAETGGQNPTG